MMLLLHKIHSDSTKSATVVHLLQANSGSPPLPPIQALLPSWLLVGGRSGCLSCIG